MLIVSKKCLEMLAIKIELDAEASLSSWILLGQSDRYGEDLGKAAMLRKATEIKDISQRREFIRVVCKMKV